MPDTSPICRTVKGYVVQFRVVMGHHDHRTLYVFQPYSPGGYSGPENADEAKEWARRALMGVGLSDFKAGKIESVFPVGVEQ